MSKKTGRANRTEFEEGSGNIFADIGLPQPEEALAKARLAEALDDTIRRRGLTQGEAARIMGADQADVSKLVNDRLDGFSQERLIHYLTALGDDVEIVVRFPRLQRRRAPFSHHSLRCGTQFPEDLIVGQMAKAD